VRRRRHVGGFVGHVDGYVGHSLVVVRAVVSFAEPRVFEGVRRGKVVTEQEPEFPFVLFGDEDKVDFAKFEVVWWGSGCEGECEFSGSDTSDWD